MQPTTRARVLFITGDVSLLESTLPVLRSSGYVPYVISDAVPSSIAIIARTVQAIVIDAGGRNERTSAWDLLRYLLRVTQAPCIAVTGHRRTDQRLQALREGAHDAVSRPIDGADLVGRLDGLVRSGLPIICPPSVMLGPRTAADLTDALVATGGRVTPLTASENRLLSYLVYHANRLITKEELCHHLGMSQDERGQLCLRQAVSKLRRKIESTPDSFAQLVTERGQGYYLRVHDPWTRTAAVH
jgi:DNA-binding response OmpR family regulator